jgi:hypothetical protein
MESPKSQVAALRNFLQSLPQTVNISDEIRNQLMPLLEEAWASLSGTREENTFASKLYRAEGVAWTPPIVTFTLERHAGTVNGSSRAELHHWIVNVETEVAKIQKKSRRQLSPIDKRLDVAALAIEARKRIVAGEEHDSLNWIDKSHVVILIGEIIPTTNAQTTSSRRGRFSMALDQEMKKAGWEEARKGNRAGYKWIEPPSASGNN